MAALAGDFTSPNILKKTTNPLSDIDISGLSGSAAMGWDNNYGPAGVAQQAAPSMFSGVQDFLGLNSTTGLGKYLSNLGISNDTMNTLFGGMDPKTGKGFGGVVPGAANALSSISGMYTGMKQMELADKMYNLNKNTINANMENQRTTANNALYEKGRATAATRGLSGDALEAYAQRVVDERGIRPAQV